MTRDGLAAQQAALAALIVRATPPADDDDAILLAAGNERLSPAQQVEIYRSQFFIRHIDVLREDFASIAHLVGEVAFDALARAYLAAHPPYSFSLRDLGHAMPDFVEGDLLLIDLAGVEWAFVEAFDAPAAPSLDRAALEAIPAEAWDRLRVIFHPSVQRLALTFPAHEYRLAVRAGAKPERPAPSVSHVVVYRGAEHLHVLDLEPAAYALIDALMQGALLGEACEQASKIAPLESKLAGWFQQWTTLALISSLRPEA